MAAQKRRSRLHGRCCTRTNEAFVGSRIRRRRGWVDTLIFATVALLLSDYGDMFNNLFVKGFISVVDSPSLQRTVLLASSPSNDADPPRLLAHSKIDKRCFASINESEEDGLSNAKNMTNNNNDDNNNGGDQQQCNMQRKKRSADDISVLAYQRKSRESSLLSSDDAHAGKLSASSSVKSKSAIASDKSTKLGVSANPVMITGEGSEDDGEEPNIARNLNFLSQANRRDFLATNGFAAATAAVVAMNNQLYGDKRWAESVSFQAARRYPAESYDGNENVAASIPFSSVRRYKSITLPNGLRVLLVSDKMTTRSSVALTVAGAGQFADPTDLGGLSHLLEHMVLSSRPSSLSRSQDFEDWLDGVDGASNGFTAYDYTCFHCFVTQNSAFTEVLQRFAALFVANTVAASCRDSNAIAREVRRIQSEIDVRNLSCQSLYILKDILVGEDNEHPYGRFTAGNVGSLETGPNQRGIDVSQRLQELFDARYTPANARLVVMGPHSLSTLEKDVAPFATVLSNKVHAATPTVLPIPTKFPRLFSRNPLSPQVRSVLLFRGKVDNPIDDKLERLTIHWPLSLDYGNIQNSRSSTVTASQVAFVLSQILGRRGPGSIVYILQQRGWVPPQTSQGTPRFSVPVDVDGFQLIKMELQMTFEGFANRSAVLSAILGSVQASLSTFGPNRPLGSNLLRRELMAQYASTAQLVGSILAPRPPDAIELAVDELRYGAAFSPTSWSRFPMPDNRPALDQIQSVVSDTLRMMSDPSTGEILITASPKAIMKCKSKLINSENALPNWSPASWDIASRTGARYFIERHDFRRLFENELTPPVPNPLVPLPLRPARVLKTPLLDEPIILQDMNVQQELTDASDRTRGDMNPFLRLLVRDRDVVVNENDVEFSTAIDQRAVESSVIRDYWAVLPTNGQDQLPLPRIPPEASARCAFVLQFLSSRPARANVRMAAHAELWKVSFEQAVGDLAEVGVPAGLAYELSFNKFGMRLAFLGLSQNIASYARRIGRRMVEHQTRLFETSDATELPVDAALRNAARAPGVSPQRRKQILSILRESTSNDAALESVGFFKSCSGAVAFSQGDMLPKETVSLLADLKTIFRPVTGSNIRPVPATPEISDLVYRPVWLPRSASVCATPGAVLMSDACGRVAR